MNGRGGGGAPANGGEFLLQLLRNPPSSNPHTSPTYPQPTQTLSQDPAVAAVGPSIPNFHLPQAAAFPPNFLDFPQNAWNNSTFLPFPSHNYLPQNPNLNPDFHSPLGGFTYSPHQFNHHSIRTPVVDDSRKLGPCGENPNLIFGSLSRDVLQDEAGDVLRRSLFQHNSMNYTEVNGNSRGNHGAFRRYEQERSGNSSSRINQGVKGSQMAVAPPPGFSGTVKKRELDCGKKVSDHTVGKAKGSFENMYKNDGLSSQLESPGEKAGNSFQSFSALDMKKVQDHGSGEMDSLDHFAGSLLLENDIVEKSPLVIEDESGKKKHSRDKKYRSDERGQWIMAQRMRNLKKSNTTCRSDIHRFNAPFLAVYESLIPADEEKVKQKQLLTLLEKLIAKEWPEARLYLYGSCANSFGFSKSDIDVCLSMDLGNNDKSHVLLKLAEILQSDNLQNVQALTRARVPVVKLMDPVTGISCDICVNNVLAVVNTKLLHDYAHIDVRLRQLAFIVKHWAKSRGVNDTYRGTLSSYAYVLMCIHFLQQRRPPILPCLQGMEITYSRNADNIECAYYDKVEKLENYGSLNGESIAQLVWGFFFYWAYCHDYANDVVSVRTGSTLSKRGKVWTKRVGKDRHLICIEDPFEVSHDLGRVVDKRSIRVLRQEFERAAEITQSHSNPCEALFEPYM